MKRNALHSLFTLGTALLVTAFAPACSSDDNDAAPGNGSSDGPTEKPIHTLVVAADGSGDYTTLQEAFDALPVDGEPHIVRLRPGTYCEKVTLTADHPRVTLIGDDAEKCIITYDDYAGHPIETGNGTLGTWRSQTLLIEADDFTACGVTIANTYVNSQANAAVNKDTQAVALRVEGDRVTLYECRVTGYQDTLFGRGTGRVYLRDCYVEGNVDFIFGSSTIVVDHCTLHMNRNNSVVTAPSTPADHRYGIVCMDCTISFPPSDEVDFDGSKFSCFHLGRGWYSTKTAKPCAVFIRCEEPAALKAEGWTAMSDQPDPTLAQPLFAEYGCTGPGAAADRLAQRACGGRQLSDAEGAEYVVANIFARSSAPEYTSDWLPATAFTDPGE